MLNSPKHKEALAKIAGVIKEYDLAAMIVIGDQERTSYRIYFPTWGVISLEHNKPLGKAVRFKSLRKDFPSKEAQHEATELSAHIVLSFRDMAAMLFKIFDDMTGKLREHMDIEHNPGPVEPDRDN